MDTMTRAAAGGVAGALTLTLLHETARRVVPDPPRMDTYGRRMLAYGMEAAGVEPPHFEGLQAMALGGDLVANGLCYALVGLGSPEIARSRGALVGALMGLSAVVLPPYLGLGTRPRGRNPVTMAMTFGLYFAGGLAAGEVCHRLGVR